MAHARQQLRDAVKLALTGLPLTGDRVYVGRTRPLGAEHQPTLLIYSPAETSQRDANGNPPILARALTLYIEARVVSAEPPDDLLDDIAVEVEAAMGADRSLGNRLRNMQYVGMQIDVEAPGKSHIGGMRLEYRLTYRTPEGAAATLA